jgi:endonuclease/exonuclease/phosphatase family metal-dependent hydrolase
MLWGVRPRRWETFDASAVCRDLDADVLVLQESYRPDGDVSVAERVATELGYEHTEAVLARSVVDPKPRVLRAAEAEYSTGDWGMALLTRVPATVRVAPLPRHPRDKAQRVVLVADITIDGTQVTVAGTHLPHFQCGSLGLRDPLVEILPSIDQPGVLAGDFNMWGRFAEWLVPGWRRAFRGATWPAHRPHSHIDHILVTPAVTVVEAGVVPLVVSDHLPVRAVIEV